MNNENIQNTMDNLSQLLGYKTSEKSDDDKESGNMDEYKRAAEILENCVVEEGIEITTDSEEIKKALEAFKSAYSLEKLESLAN